MSKPRVFVCGKSKLPIEVQLKDIAVADVVYAYLGDAFTETFELGFAHALGKRTVIGMAECTVECIYPFSEEVSTQYKGSEDECWAQFMKGLEG
jgi:hypothetical protein